MCLKERAYLMEFEAYCEVIFIIFSGLSGFHGWQLHSLFRVIREPITTPRSVSTC